MKSKLSNSALYLGDNGRLTCGAHAGATAQATGHDLSGLRMLMLRADDLAYLKATIGRTPMCETCRAIAERAAA